jgi:Tfp pilus assembly protein PilE
MLPAAKVLLPDGARTELLGDGAHLMKRPKNGFSIIEVLMILIVIGILASIMIPRFADSKEKTYIAQMTSDLRSLATYEDQYAAENGGGYFAGTASMTAPLHGFHTSEHVTIVVSTFAAPTASWRAVARHSLTSRNCDITNGVVSCS